MTSLSERIAALQQKTQTSPKSSPHSSPRANDGMAITAKVNLKERIATFEKRGGMPIPRGSFGLGAPPSTSHSPSRELYGNRIIRASSSKLSSPKALPLRQRCVSTSNINFSASRRPSIGSSDTQSLFDGDSDSASYLSRSPRDSQLSLESPDDVSGEAHQDEPDMPSPGLDIVTESPPLVNVQSTDPPSIIIDTPPIDGPIPEDIALNADPCLPGAASGPEAIHSSSLSTELPSHTHSPDTPSISMTCTIQTSPSDRLETACPPPPIFDVTSTTVLSSAEITPSKLPEAPPIVPLKNLPPRSKSKSKRLIPGWYDDESDEDDEGGWGSVVITTRRY
ncbi:hypothetical protein SISNIDRAFT_216954 [Sistotremastrum niveocremeum HHB9708]|uniref:Uncharacterized protein n=1 Tax=Sistotremastrum niveocremeum HHB9708 TaxID=1314777 RepID=A0A164QW05_9AGAM|nr:hypothetical protein SISNIDRAFT_216954 [Sistotremastrum niveocremeum HHB9708]